MNELIHDISLNKNKYVTFQLIWCVQNRKLLLMINESFLYENNIYLSQIYVIIVWNGCWAWGRWFACGWCRATDTAEPTAPCTDLLLINGKTWIDWSLKGLGHRGIFRCIAIFKNTVCTFVRITNLNSFELIQ